MRRTSQRAVIGVAVMLVGSGCGSAEAPSRGPAASENVPAVTSGSTPPAAPPQGGTLIDVTIAGGTLTPTNAEVEAVAGQPIVLAVDSDAADSIHVHSVPEHVFEVQPRPGQRFEFSVGIPGKVDVELHELNRTIVTIAVRPR